MELTPDVRQALRKIHTWENQVWEAWFEFAPDLPMFQGHFPGHAILPGVYQVGCMLETFYRGSGRRPGLAAIKAAKFQAVVAPPCIVVVRVAEQRPLGAPRLLLRAEMFHQGATCATALLDMGPADPEAQACGL